MANPNLELLLKAADVLRPILDEFVFVGGCATGLLVTDSATSPVRTTVDVDAIVEVASYSAYVDFSSRLRQLGLREDTAEGAPICRWKQGDLRIDVMPLEEGILGFSNRWYRQAIQAPDRVKLNDDFTIKVITAPYFLATKLEAFRERGLGDYLRSHDLEDLVSVVDGRSSLITEISVAPLEVQAFVGGEIRSMLERREFKDALPGFLPPDSASQERVLLVLERLKQLGNLQA